MAPPRWSNIVFAVFNVVTLLLGAAVLAAGIYAGATHRCAATDCERFLRTPALVLGPAIMAASLVALAGACSRATALLWIYLILAWFLIVATIGFAAFALAVTKARAGRAVPGRGFREYRLGDYSSSLARIRSCLLDADVCRSLLSGWTLDEFVNANLSPVQDAASPQPRVTSYQNETYWTKPPGTGGGDASAADPDCGAWSNDQSELCYGCQSCKAGVLGKLRNSPGKVALINAAFVTLLLVVYSLGCCALQNNRRHKYSLVEK